MSMWVSTCLRILFLSPEVFPQLVHSTLPFRPRCIIDSSRDAKSRRKVIRVWAWLHYSSDAWYTMRFQRKWTNSHCLFHKLMGSNHHCSYLACCPRRQNFIWMLLGIVVAKSVSGLKVLSTNNAWMGHIQMNFSMSFCLAFLGRSFPTSDTNILPISVAGLSDHRLDHCIQI